MFFLGFIFVLTHTVLFYVCLILSCIFGLLFYFYNSLLTHSGTFPFSFSHNVHFPSQMFLLSSRLQMVPFSFLCDLYSPLMYSFPLLIFTQSLS